MPPTSEGFHWRKEDAYIAVTGEAFAKKVAEEKLKVEGPFSGYWYAERVTEEGSELWRTPAKTRYFWAFRQVCTQDNVAGGNLVATITPPAGAAMVPVAGRLSASGNRAAYIIVQNGDADTISTVSTVAAIAGATAVLRAAPGAYTASGAGEEICAPIAYPNRMLGQVTAAAQTETATLSVYFELIGTSTAPTVSWAGSGGTPNAAAASENTVTSVVEI